MKIYLLLGILLLAPLASSQTFSQEVLVSEEDAGFAVAVQNKDSRIWPDTSPSHLGIAYHDTSTIGVSMKSMATGSWTHTTAKTGETVEHVFLKWLSGTTWILFWSESNSGQVWSSKSTDNGATWGANINVGTGGICSGGCIHFADNNEWSIRKFGNDNYHFTSDGGATYTSSDICRLTFVASAPESMGYRVAGGTTHFIDAGSGNPMPMVRGSSTTDCVGSETSHGTFYSTGGGAQLPLTYHFSVDRGVITQVQPLNTPSGTDRLVLVSNLDPNAGTIGVHSAIRGSIIDPPNGQSYTGSAQQIHVTPTGSTYACAIAYGDSGTSGTTRTEVWTTIGADHKCDSGNETTTGFSTTSYPAEYGIVNHALFDAKLNLYYISTVDGDIVSLTSTDEALPADTAGNQASEFDSGLKDFIAQVGFQTATSQYFAGLILMAIGFVIYAAIGAQMVETKTRLIMGGLVTFLVASTNLLLDWWLFWEVTVVSILGFVAIYFAIQGVNPLTDLVQRQMMNQPTQQESFIDNIDIEALLGES